MLISSAVNRLARDTRGFTLMETLVAMITGVLVTGALFAILEVSMNQTTRLSDVAQATQLGRATMTRMVDQLHTACISSGFTPVQEKSSGSELIFESGFSEKAEIPSGRLDKVVWSKTTGKLTDNIYTSTGGSWPSFTFPSSPTSSVTIGEHIAQSSEATPIFTYYAYSTKSSTTPTAPSSTLEEKTPLTVPLSKTEAAKVASVLIGFKAAPNDNKAEMGRGVDLSSQVIFAFSAPSSEAPIEAAPCE
jgi:Tfp pilus assembly protein PilW